MTDIKQSKSQESSNAIERIYITMRHLFNRGFYKPMGVSGKTLREALLTLQPEIYGSIAGDKTELDGLLYIIDRLPEGITECRFINLTADEGFTNSHFKSIIPAKRRRNCYRIDKNQMNIEITRGRSDVYDVLTHLTFLYIESHKISAKVLLNDEGKVIREWTHLENTVLQNKKLDHKEKEVLFSYLSNILGRSFGEIQVAFKQFATTKIPNRFFEIIYWMGKLAINEIISDQKHEITFSSILRERIGHHIYGDLWATNIKEKLVELGLHKRNIHIISANMHSVMNSLYAAYSLPKESQNHQGLALYELMSKEENDELRKIVKNTASKNGLIYLRDHSGTNI
ncbi:MAG: hypothetical protein J7K34_10890, partial [Flavobacteriaceae bacterium]|nr:hypothetical protein [Flavobacteriaceae bacterium]